MASFDPNYLAALTTKSEPAPKPPGGETPHKARKKAVNATALSALHGVNAKNNPVIQPPVKSTPPQATILQGDGFPPPGDPYWKQHPILTQHGNEDRVRPWGEDTLVNAHNPNTLPKQMLPPPPVKQTPQPKDYYEGHDVPGSGHMRYYQ